MAARRRAEYATERALPAKHDEVRVQSADLSEIAPAQDRADLVVLLVP
jgi:hypothetical protein